MTVVVTEAGPVTLAAAGTVIVAAAGTGTAAVATGAAPAAANPSALSVPFPFPMPLHILGRRAVPVRSVRLPPPHRLGSGRFLPAMWRESFVIMESGRPTMAKMAIHLRRYLCDHGPCPAGVPGMFRAPSWFALLREVA